MKFIINLVFLFFCTNGVSLGQNASIDIETKASKDPVSFTHQPILLLKVTPTGLLENDNILQFGGEVAPPFGKVSFNFDYGIGRGKWSLNKYVRNNLTDTETKLWRAEIRTYFSDLVPFYALDKKPFGRYYALEVFSKTLTRTQPVGLGVGGATLPNYVKISGTAVTLTEQGIHLKFGKHFIINRFFFVDAFVGLGPGRYELVENTEEKGVADITNEVIHNNFSLKRNNWKVGTKGLFLSRNTGIRLCLAL